MNENDPDVGDGGAADAPSYPAAPAGLDPATPEEWAALRARGHRMLDAMFDHLETLRDRPLWQPAPAEAAAALGTAKPPLGPTPLAEIEADFMRFVLPYGGGNLHPGFMGWVQGGGTAVGMLAEMLAGGLNANLGGRNHAPIAVERQVAGWVAQLFGYPEGAGGQFLTGASQANFVAVHLARLRTLGARARVDGGRPEAARLVAYASEAVHGCVPRAMELAGLGRDALRLIPTDDKGRIDLAALDGALADDRAAGARPFLLIGSAGTVNTGAIDDLAALADRAEAEGLHFHVDGALGAPAQFSARLRSLLDGIARSDSLAFDFHKLAQVPYDAGFLLVRDEQWQRAAFAADNSYLTRAASGLAAGAWWPCDTGPDLSRGFRALKAWFTLRHYGIEALGRVVEQGCDLASHAARRVAADPRLELRAPVALNVVCFGIAGTDDAGHAAIVEALHAGGRVAPSLTVLDGRRAIRAAFVNHRSTTADADALIDGVLALAAPGTGPQGRADSA